MRDSIVTFAVLLTCVVACSPAHAQTMYRCGNTWQDKPCADGKGSVVGTTGAPRTGDTGTGRPAPASGTPGKTGQRATTEASPRELQLLQSKAKSCLSMRMQVPDAKGPYLEHLHAQTRKERCAWLGSDFETERRCAVAKEADLSRHCSAYAHIGPWPQ